MAIARRSLILCRPVRAQVPAPARNAQMVLEKKPQSGRQQSLAARDLDAILVRGSQKYKRRSTLHSSQHWNIACIGCCWFLWFEMLFIVGVIMDTYTPGMAPDEEGQETDQRHPGGEARTGLQGARSTWGRLFLPWMPPQALGKGTNIYPQKAFSTESKKYTFVLYSRKTAITTSKLKYNKNICFQFPVRKHI